MRTAFIRERLYSINSYLSGVDGKGYDCFADDIGLDPLTFGKLHRARKLKLLERVVSYVRMAVHSELGYIVDNYKNPTDLNDIVLDDLARLGEATGSLNWLLDYYGASSATRDMETE